MADPITRIEKNRINKYLKDGKLPLSAGFFQRLFVDGDQGCEVPIVQIHRIDIFPDNDCAKLTLCDGMNVYPECFVQGEEYGPTAIAGILEVKENQPDAFPIILAKEVEVLPAQISFGPIRIRLNTYELLCKCRKVPGYPLPPREEMSMMRAMKSPDVFAPILIETSPVYEASTGERQPVPLRYPQNRRPSRTRVDDHSPPRLADKYDPPTRDYLAAPLTPRDVTRSTENSAAGSTSRPRIPEDLQNPPSPTPRITSSPILPRPTPRSMTPSSQISCSPPPPYSPIPRLTSSDAPSIPIAKLAPGIGNWHIVGCCTAADELGVTKKNVKVFNFELTDEQGTPIKIYTFGEHAEEAYKTIEIGKSYRISNAFVKNVIDLRCNSTGHAYELTANSSDILRSAKKVPIPPLSLETVPLSRVASYVDKCIDIAAIISQIRPVSEFTNKNGVHCVRRDVELKDTTRSTIIFTLHSRQAREFRNEFQGKVIGIKQARVEDYKGRIKISGARRFEINPVLDETTELLDWNNKEKEARSVNKSAGSSSERQIRNASQGFNPISLRMASEHIGECVDVLAVVDTVKSISKFRNKLNDECTMREVSLIDSTNTKIVLNLWDDEAETFHEQKGSVIGIKGAKVEQYKGKISLKGGCRIVELPSHEVIELYKWYTDRSDKADNLPKYQKRSPETPDTVKIINLNEVETHMGKEVDILAVVHKVSDVAEFRNKKGNLCMIREVELIDHTSTVIPLVLWWGQAKEFNPNSKGHVIHIKSGKVETHKGRSVLNNGRMEMDPTIKEAAELLQWYKQNHAAVHVNDERPASGTPTEIDHNRVLLNQLPQCAGKYVDILAIVDKVNPVRPFVDQSGAAGSKREVQLVDHTCTTVKWVLWSYEAQQFSEEMERTVIALKGVLVRDFNGNVSLSKGKQSTVDLSEENVNVLRKWYLEHRDSAEMKNISQVVAGNNTANGEFTLNAIPLNQITQHSDQLVDILAVIDNVKPLLEFQNKKGVDCIQRIVELVDRTCTKVNLVLWKEKAKEFSAKEGDIIGIKGSKVSEYKGYFSVTAGCQMEINPKATKTVRVGALKDWYKFVRDTEKVKSISLE